MIEEFNPDAAMGRAVGGLLKRVKEKTTARHARGMGKANMVFQMELMTRMIEAEQIDKLCEMLNGPFAMPDVGHEEILLDYAVRDGALYQMQQSGWVKAYDFGAQNVVSPFPSPVGHHRIASLDYSHCYLPVGNR